MVPAVMPAIAAKDPSLVATLEGGRLPLQLDSGALPDVDGSDPVAFRFVLRDLPFSCGIEHVEGRPVLTLTGDLGALPYSAEGAERRCAMQAVLAEARERSGLDWEVTEQQILVRGGPLAPPLTPVATILGAVTLLLRALPLLERLLDAHEV